MTKQLVDIKLIYFEGCPNAEGARLMLEKTGIQFRLIEQTKLDLDDPYRGYTSPSILLDGKLVFGAKTEGKNGGCSIGRHKLEKVVLFIEKKIIGKLSQK